MIILITVGSALVGATIGVKAAMSYLARRYLDAAIGIVQTHAVKRHAVDWTALRTEAYERNRNALTRSDTYETIRFVLTSLGDHHSGLLSPEMVSGLNRLTADDNPSPDGRVLSERLGYIRVPSFVSGNQQAVDLAATHLHRIVQAVEAQHPCGWIVDLQNDGGGNMWPMLAGLGPILGEGRLGAFIDPEGRQTTWSYASGAAREADQPRARVLGAGYRSQAATAPVAVLISRGTASSGEAVTIAFVGRPNTRSFGQPTRGLSTSNDQFLLSDGAIINLSVSVFADRNGHQYPSGIDPDERAVTSASAPIPSAATAWLRQQPACLAQ
ncbi:MAG TPA: S41 family peptidase [Vicinamibacterales bacterium]|nr:S41 family peptidase [Vicinamibacterales bacterium]